MSLSLLKKELEKASAELSTSSVGESSKKKKFSLGTERHGMKKKMIKMRSKKVQNEKYKFKFSDEYVSESKNKTKAVLKQLASLDRIGKKVSASKIVEDNLKKKRNVRVKENESLKDKEDHGSILFTEEELVEMEKQLFLHSKPKMSNKEL